MPHDCGVLQEDGFIRALGGELWASMADATPSTRRRPFSGIFSWVGNDAAGRKRELILFAAFVVAQT